MEHTPDEDLWGFYTLVLGHRRGKVGLLIHIQGANMDRNDNRKSLTLTMLHRLRMVRNIVKHPRSYNKRRGHVQSLSQ